MPNRVTATFTSEKGREKGRTLQITMQDNYPCKIQKKSYKNRMSLFKIADVKFKKEL